MLLYYSLMNLAIAEILLKQSGDSSLDRAREQHRHHGLSFSLNPISGKDMVIEKTLGQLTAELARKSNGEHYGTFALWLRSARGAPMIAKVIDHSSGSRLSSYRAVGLPVDDVFDAKITKISLADCIGRLPALYTFCNTVNVQSQFMRCQIEGTTNADAKSGRFALAIHPGDQAVYEATIAQIKVRSDCIPAMQYDDHGHFGTMIYQHSQDFPMMFRLPLSCNIYTDECMLCAPDPVTNEFGYYYLSLYMCGNYARYYPDHWIRDMASSSFLSTAVNEVMHTAQERVPLLALSEFERAYNVLDR